VGLLKEQHKMWWASKESQLKINRAIPNIDLTQIQ